MPYVIVLPNPPKMKGIDAYYAGECSKWDSRLEYAYTFQRVNNAIDFVKKTRKYYFGDWQRAVVQRIEYEVTTVGDYIKAEHENAKS